MKPEKLVEEVTVYDLACVIGQKLILGSEKMAIRVGRGKVFVTGVLADPKGLAEPISIEAGVETVGGGRVLVRVYIMKVDADGRPLDNWRSDWGYRIESSVGQSLDQFGPQEIGLAMQVTASLGVSDEAKEEILRAEERSLIVQLKKVFERFPYGELSAAWAESASSEEEVYRAIKDLLVN